MLLPDLEDSIERFLNFFEEKLEVIRKAEFEQSESLFKKTLYVAIMDALSKTTSNKKKGNRPLLIIRRHFLRMERL